MCGLATWAVWRTSVSPESEKKKKKNEEATMQTTVQTNTLLNHTATRLVKKSSKLLGYY